MEYHFKLYIDYISKNNFLIFLLTVSDHFIDRVQLETYKLHIYYQYGSVLNYGLSSVGCINNQNNTNIVSGPATKKLTK